jgi:hypothetical protein
LSQTIPVGIGGERIFSRRQVRDAAQERKSNEYSVEKSFPRAARLSLVCRG